MEVRCQLQVLATFTVDSNPCGLYIGCSLCPTGNLNVLEKTKIYVLCLYSEPLLSNPQHTCYTVYAIVSLHASIYIHVYIVHNVCMYILVDPIGLAVSDIVHSNPTGEMYVSLL